MNQKRDMKQVFNTEGFPPPAQKKYSLAGDLVPGICTSLLLIVSKQAYIPRNGSIYV